MNARTLHITYGADRMYGATVLEGVERTLWWVLLFVMHICLSWRGRRANLCRSRKGFHYCCRPMHPTAAQVAHPTPAAPTLHRYEQQQRESAAGGAKEPLTLLHAAAEATGLPDASQDLVSVCLVCHELPQVRICRGEHLQALNLVHSCVSQTPVSFLCACVP